MPQHPDLETAEYAHYYRSLGLQAVPARMPSEGADWKRPALWTWKEHSGALVSDSVFALWYGPSGRHLSRTNLGLLTGSASERVFVLDADTHKHFEAQHWLDGVLAFHNNGMAFETATQRTGGGGFQYLFRAPLNWHSPTCKTSIGIDIRGEGGFAMLPPSVHESGNEYAWISGKEPWETGILDAPQWLRDEIDALIAKHGGKESRGSSSADNGKDRPQQAVNASGKMIDGREDYMASLIWARVVALHRECPIHQGTAAQDAECLKAFDAYLQNVASRIEEPGTPLVELLERERRGITEFKKKWCYAMNQWDGDVGRAAKDVPEPMDISGLRTRAEVEAEYKTKADTDRHANDNYDFGDVSTFRLDTYTQGTPPPQKFLLEPIMPQGVVGLLFGEGGLGKSFVALDLCIQIAKRAITQDPVILWPGPLGGRIPDNAGGATVFITLEDDRSEIHRRTTSVDPDGIRFSAPVYVIPALDLPNFDPTLVRDEKRNAALTALATKHLPDLLDNIIRKSGHHIALLALDPAGDFINADENSATYVKALMRHLRVLSQRFGCTILLLGHTAKNDGKQSMRGSSAWVANSRFAYALWKPNDKEDVKRAVQLVREHGLDAGRIVFGSLIKANHAGAPVDRLTKYVRDSKSGRLIEASDHSADQGPTDTDLVKALVASCAEYAAAGMPFTHTGVSGLYEGREDLPEPLSTLSKVRLTKLGEVALGGGLLVKAKTGAGNSPPKWLDVPDGPLAKGADIELPPGSRREALARHKENLAEPPDVSNEPPQILSE